MFCAVFFYCNISKSDSKKRAGNDMDQKTYTMMNILIQKTNYICLSFLLITNNKNQRSKDFAMKQTRTID